MTKGEADQKARRLNSLADRLSTVISQANIEAGENRFNHRDDTRAAYERAIKSLGKVRKGNPHPIDELDAAQDYEKAEEMLLAEIERIAPAGDVSS